MDTLDNFKLNPTRGGTIAIAVASALAGAMTSCFTYAMLTTERAAILREANSALKNFDVKPKSV